MNTKKLVVFDLDNTLITGNIWEQFNSYLGVNKEQDQNLYSAFAKGEITYDEWLTKLKNLYQLDTNKHPKAAILECLTQNELNTSASSVMQAITKKGYNTLLLAGSFQMTADAVAFELGITDAVATTQCLFDEADMLCDIHSVGNERQAKVTLLRAYCDDHDIQMQNCVVVGSGGNNLELFSIASKSITFTSSNQELQAAATHVVNDLSEIPTVLFER